MKKMSLDVLGNEIKVGDYVIFSQSDKNVKLELGIVTIKFKSGKVAVVLADTKDDDELVRNAKDCIVISETKINK